MKSLVWRYLFLTTVAGAVVVLDQITKWWIRTHLELGQVIFLLRKPLPVRLVHWYNRGGVFGLFQEFSWLWTLLALIITLVLLRFYPRLSTSWPLRWGLAFQLGGALGNLVDRFLLGHVTDFISVSRFPIFNVADMAITLGIFLLLIGTWKHEIEAQAQAESEALAPTSETATAGESLVGETTPAPIPPPAPEFEPPPMEHEAGE